MGEMTMTVSYYDRQLELSEDPDGKRWATEFVRIAKAHPELVRNKKAMEKLFEAAFDAGRSSVYLDW